ncbi:MAG: HAMP domain-containing sensor histidine kinase [Pseudomonadota bacterium]
MQAEDPKLDISTFLITSVHDMKNSMGVMMAYLQDALTERNSLPPATRDKTTQALYEAQRVTDHLLQLLALYKIDQEFYPFDPQDHPLADLAQEALARVMDLADLKGISLDCHCPDELYGWIDHELVFGVLVQALHNALRYAHGQVLLSLAGGDDGIRISVEDDGPGYPDFLLAQGDGRTRGISFETGSTGLGLYFAGVVAALHRNGQRAGRIRLVNGGTLGGGVFTLELP